MRRLMGAERIKEVTRPVAKIGREANGNEANADIYTETRRARGFETVHVLK